MSQKPELETMTLTVSFEVEPLTLDILKNQATWQGLSMDEMVAYYVARVATVMEEQHGNALISDVFKDLQARNAPTTQKGSPRYIEKAEREVVETINAILRRLPAGYPTGTLTKGPAGYQLTVDHTTIFRDASAEDAIKHTTNYIEAREKHPDLPVGVIYGLYD
jgi:hypothetical protein